MTNARCLTEGVDVPAIDCVMFADPKQSRVDIVQAAGRALRQYQGKEYGYIVVPLVVPDRMEFEKFAETTVFGKSHKQSLRSQRRTSVSPMSSEQLNKGAYRAARLLR